MPQPLLSRPKDASGTAIGMPRPKCRDGGGAILAGRRGDDDEEVAAAASDELHFASQAACPRWWQLRRKDRIHRRISPPIIWAVSVGSCHSTPSQRDFLLVCSSSTTPATSLLSAVVSSVPLFGPDPSISGLLPALNIEHVGWRYHVDGPASPSIGGSGSGSRLPSHGWQFDQTYKSSG